MNDQVNAVTPLAVPEGVDLAEVDRLIEAAGTGPESAIPILQAIQVRWHYLPEEALRRVCERTRITPAQLAGVSTFYTFFRHKPAGRHRVCVCHGTACHVNGSERIQEAVERSLGIEPGQDTDAGRMFTVERVACVGCCTLAPVVVIDSNTYGRNTAERVPDLIRDFLAARDRAGAGGAAAAAPRAAGAVPLVEIRVGVGSCCVASGSQELRETLERVLRARGIQAAVRPVGCVGMCHRTPLVEIVQPGGGGGSALAAGPEAGTDAGAVPGSAVYARVAPEDIERVVDRHFRPRGPVRRLASRVRTALDRLLTDEAWTPVSRYEVNVRDGQVCAFLGPQVRIATEHCGSLDPLDADAYAAAGGFAALRRAVGESRPDGVIEAVREAGLRGRGGAGFPTAEKWRITRAQPSEVKYMVCNGDEGDPGAFMDRMILESYPYRVLEGMAIAAWAVGAREGFLYVRAEYPLAVERARAAVGRMEQLGLLGEGMLDGRWSLKLTVKEGGGAFVCGEETALIASLEGGRGLPRYRPPYPAEEGLWGRPTCVNNVETLALVPWILRNGPAAFAALGMPSSRGTKVFALAGKVRRGGLIEVPMGITIRRIVEEIGGGVAEGRRFKAVQIGGPSGGCIPESLADTPVDYEALSRVGAIMGSGGLVVLDDRDCMVDMARYFLQFTQDQSCGKCTFCRVGTRRMLDILERLCRGEGRGGDLDRLEALAREVRRGSLCQLGGTAPNPVLTTLRYFRDEYAAHLAGECPAGRCRALVEYRVTDDCIGCTRCAQRCPVDAIPFTPYEKHAIDSAACTRCDICRTQCPANAIVVGRRTAAGTASPVEIVARGATT